MGLGPRQEEYVTVGLQNYYKEGEETAEERVNQLIARARSQRVSVGSTVAGRRAGIPCSPARGPCARRRRTT
eukprot:2637563-Alexandrium_andersonii.AAC.1